MKKISIKKAKEIAASWHGGQNTALYSFASTGRILPGRIGEYLQEITESKEQNEKSSGARRAAGLLNLTKLGFFFSVYREIINQRRAILNTPTGKADNKELSLAIEGKSTNIRIWIGRKYAPINPDNTLCLYMRLDKFSQFTAPVCTGNSHLIDSPVYKAICKRFSEFAPRIDETTINDIIELTLTLRERETKQWQSLGVYYSLAC